MGAMTQMNLSEARERAGLHATRSRGSWSAPSCPFLRRRRGRAGLLSLLPRVRREPYDDADIGFSKLLGRTSPARPEPVHKPPVATPSQAPAGYLSDSYHGFSLTWTPQPWALSDEIVMKVRSEETVPYRGVASTITTEGLGDPTVTPRRSSPRTVCASTRSRPRIPSQERGRSGRLPRVFASRRTPEHHLRRYVPRRSSSYQQYQDRSVRLSQGALPDPRGLSVLGHSSLLNASPDQLRSAVRSIPKR